MTTPDGAGTGAPESRERPRWPARLQTSAACVGSGLLIAGALPPWGWWPLAFVGVAAFDRLIAGQSARRRFGRTWLIFAALLFPTFKWMGTFTPPGYVIAVVAYSAYFGLAAAAAPPDRRRWAVLPFSVAVAEIARWTFPFGGVPISTFAMGQVGGPLAPLARLGGSLLIVVGAVALGCALSAATRPEGRKAAGAISAAVALAVGLAMVSPDGEPAGQVDVALVQGGGPQGTTSLETNPRDVFDRHVAATRQIVGDPEIVLWPEDVVDVEGPIEEHIEFVDLQRLARDLDTPLIAGLVEGDGPDRFRNAAQLILADGTFAGRYEKVLRVPFGEYLPFRSIIERLVDTSLLPADAIPGDGPAVIDTPVGRLGVEISWEGFFGRRARDAVRNGGQLLYNPTNAASYTDIQVQAQQVASSRLRAIETGRWVVQAAPTGFTAVITPDGEVVDRTAVSESRVIEATVGLRTGQTVFTRLGDGPLTAVSVLVSAWWPAAVLRRRLGDSRRANPAADSERLAQR